MKKRLGHKKTSWEEELPLVLWAYRTTPRSTTGKTPFSLVFENEAIVPAEIQGQALRIMHFEPHENEELLRTYLMFLEEKREEARIRYNLYNRRVHEAFS